MKTRVRARQGVAMQAGEGSATGNRALRRLGRAGDEVNEKLTPSPHFISLKRYPNSHFAIIANFSQAYFT